MMAFDGAAASHTRAMECNYSVVQEETTITSGTVPVWLRGTYYHAVFSTNVSDPGFDRRDPLPISVPFG